MLEGVAIVTTLLSVWLTRKTNIWCWIFGMIGAACYFVIFAHDKSIANAGFSVISFIQCFYGLVTWHMEVDDEVTVGGFSMVLVELFAMFVIGCITYLICSHLGGQTVVLDSITAAISIVATILIAHKKLENWVYWCIADVFYIVFFINTGHNWSAVLYGIFFINAIFGYREWQKSIKARTS